MKLKLKASKDANAKGENFTKSTDEDDSVVFMRTAKQAVVKSPVAPVEVLPSKSTDVSTNSTGEDHGILLLGK